MIYIIFTNKLFHYLKEKVIIMRKITLLVLLFAVVGNIKAAHYEYIPLVRDGVEWGYSQQLFGKSYYRNLIQADTIVNNIAYKKFYTFKSCSETADENLAFIRESGKQVYITFNKLLMPVESLCDSIIRKTKCSSVLKQNVLFYKTKRTSVNLFSYPNWHKKAPKKYVFFGAFYCSVFWLSHQKSLTLNKYIIFGFNAILIPLKRRYIIPPESWARHRLYSIMSVYVAL